MSSIFKNLYRDRITFRLDTTWGNLPFLTSFLNYLEFQYSKAFFYITLSTVGHGPQTQVMNMTEMSCVHGNEERRGGGHLESVYST